jgi:GT2 family glycosyltransferase
MQVNPEVALPALSIVIPTYQREQVLVDTLALLAPLLRPGDEIVVIDQTPVHEPGTEQRLGELAAAGAVRWYRRDKAHICEAMNAGAGLARGDVVLFLDDDIVPHPNLLEAHRAALARRDAPPAVCGQVLQPWHRGPIGLVRDYALEFDAAYDKPCEILSLMAGNFSMRRDTFVQVGGFDENFSGPCYRLEAELSYRIYGRLGRKVAFTPEASIVHLKAAGGTRAFGQKDSWGHIGGSIGDYYFALRCLPCLGCLKHTVTRFVRAPINRNTVRRPWLIPWLFMREAVAWFRAAGCVWTKPNNYIKDASYYGVSSPRDAVPV